MKFFSVLLNFNKKRQAGFSLIELLTATVIMTVLAAVSVPLYNKRKYFTASKKLSTEAAGIIKAFTACHLESDDFDKCDTASELGILTSSNSVNWTLSPNDPNFCAYISQNVHDPLQMGGTDSCDYCLQIDKNTHTVKKEKGGDSNCWDPPLSTKTTCDSMGECN